MRALVMTGPSAGSDRTQIREVGEPRPGPGEVAVEVAWAGLNFVDVMARRGDEGYVQAWPHLPGKEVAGVVRSVGEGVAGLAPGQRVAAFAPAGGGLAEVAVVPAALAAPVPAEVGWPAAASAPLTLATGLLLLTHAARVGPGERVLVHSAAGGVGAAVAQLARLLGCGLRIGVVGRADREQDALAAGYDAAFTRGDGLAGAVRASSGGGVDVVLDPHGTSWLEDDLAMAAPGGRIVLFGNASGERPGPLPPPRRLMAGNVAVSGFSISSLARTAPGRAAGALRQVLDLLAAGTLSQAVTEVPSLADVPAAHDALAHGRGTGKLVARIGG